MVWIYLAFVMLLTALASGDGVTPYQVTFGADGRLRMEDFSEKTACGYESPQSPCATYQSLDSFDNVRFPLDAMTVSFPLRLDFTLKNPNTNLIEMRFMRGPSKLYAVEFERGDGLEIERSSASLDLEFDESHRFWVTYENDEVKVGLHGNDELLVEYTDPDFTTNGADGIELYSKGKTPTEWKFYEPCTLLSENEK